MSLTLLIASLFAGGKILKEKCEKPAPKGKHFDWDAYWEDVENGMTTMERIEKQRRGGYDTTK